ncbi:MAG TPA: hypothetical protein PLI62_08615 [Spirochaetota bacterium]|nr:hypothetical protein [Spirochaetota bacterium]
MAASGVMAFFTVLVLCPFCFCADDPVDRDYFMNPELVKGGAKPAPAPVIAALSENGDYVVVDFTGTATVDPDTGLSTELVYLFYGTTTHPDSAGNRADYYDDYYRLGSIKHSGLTELKVAVYVGSYTGRAYIWMTAHDGGRESDHSNVMEIDLN